MLAASTNRQPSLQLGPTSFHDKDKWLWRVVHSHRVDIVKQGINLHLFLVLHISQVKPCTHLVVFGEEDLTAPCLEIPLGPLAFLRFVLHVRTKKRSGGRNSLSSAQSQASLTFAKVVTALFDGRNRKQFPLPFSHPLTTGCSNS